MELSDTTINVSLSRENIKCLRSMIRVLTFWRLKETINALRYDTKATDTLIVSELTTYNDIYFKYEHLLLIALENMALGNKQEVLFPMFQGTFDFFAQCSYTSFSDELFPFDFYKDIIKKIKQAQPNLQKVFKGSRSESGIVPNMQTPSMSS